MIECIIMNGNLQTKPKQRTYVIFKDSYATEDYVNY